MGDYNDDNVKSMTTMMARALLSLLLMVMMVIRSSGTLLGWLIKWIKQKKMETHVLKNHLRGLVELVDEMDRFHVL